MLRKLCDRQDAQDITEYSLLLAFVVLGAVVIFVINTGSISSIWGQSANTINAASTIAAS